MEAVELFGFIAYERNTKATFHAYESSVAYSELGVRSSLRLGSGSASAPHPAAIPGPILPLLSRESKALAVAKGDDSRIGVLSMVLRGRVGRALLLFDSLLIFRFPFYLKKE